MNFIRIRQYSDDEEMVQYSIQQLISVLGLQRREIMHIIREACLIRPYRNVILLNLGRIPLIITRNQVLIMASVLTSQNDAQASVRHIKPSRHEIEQNIWELAIIEAALQYEDMIITKSFSDTVSIMQESKRNISTILNITVKRLQNQAKQLCEILHNLIENQDQLPFISFRNQNAFYNQSSSQPVSRSPSGGL